MEAYLTTSATSTVAAILIPHRQTKTPIRGGCPSIFISWGSSSFISLTGNFVNKEEALDALPEASITVSGISFGPEKVPATNIPGREVETGVNEDAFEKPHSFNSIFNFSAVSLILPVDNRPTERTTNSNSSLFILPSSVAY